MSVLDAIKGIAIGVAGRLRTPKELADFRGDRAVFLGFRAEILGMKPNAPAFLRKRLLERVKSEFFNPARSPMAKMALWGAFGAGVDWDATLDSYERALKRAVRGDDAARLELGVLESKLGKQTKGREGLRTMRQELEKLAVILRTELANVTKETDKIAAFVAPRLKLYERAKGKLERARALDEIIKRTGNPEARAQQMEGILFLAQDRNTIPVARLEMLDSSSEAVAEWKKLVKEIQGGFPGQEMLERLEMKIVQRLELELNKLEASLAKSYASRAA